MVLEQIYNNLIAGNAWLTIVKGIWVTVKISVLSLLLGTIVGALVCGMRRSKLWILSAFAKLYIAILRGSPVSMLLLLFYYGIFAKSPLDAATVAVLAFGLNTAAYVAELLRTALDATDKGQAEAARTLGFSKWQAFRLITLPQALQIAKPVYQSTIVNLILGVLRVKSGIVTVGGKTIESISRESYYSHLAVVSYNTYIFNETVRQNFILGNHSVTDDEIYMALEKVNLATFIRENGGLDKVITEDATNISGGQKQRLALAVSLIANKDIYVFDEATSNIDVESETIIMANMKALSKTKTVIVISHRLANVVPSDFIYYMELGEIKEFGTHTELMNMQGGYAKLYTTQKELEEGYVEVRA